MRMSIGVMTGVGALWLGGAAQAFPVGADVKLADIQSISNHGLLNGVYGYTIGSHTCNVGTANLTWANNGTPGLGMNAYRLHNGRLVQIGLGFAKLACCAAASTSSLCAPTCNGQGGSVLGVGCLDVYSSGWNAGQGRLAQRSSINAWTGAFSAYNTSSGDAVYKRIQVPASQIGETNYPGALYFVEGVYVATDDAQGGFRNNNATYKRVTINASNQMTLTGNPTNQPAIDAWKAHGSGVGVPDPTVTVDKIDVPGEGRFYYAHKVRDLGNGTWRYDYAVYNLSSDRSGGSLTIPVPSGVNVTNLGFHAPLYHSGEIYSNTPWTMTRTANAVVFASPQTHAQNPNTNALRWGTMYNFWFDADTPPTTVTATLGLFKPGTPESISWQSQGPGAPPCDADVNCDGSVDGFDVETMEQAVGGNMANFCQADADFNHDGSVDGFDVESLEQVVGGSPCP
jgi:hypothetical protein